MNENQNKQNNLLDSTDCLEAVGVLRGWKNALFIITFCCLLGLQASFWAVDLGLVKIDSEAVGYTKTSLPADAGLQVKPTDNPETTKMELAKDMNKIEKAAEQVASDSNVPAEAAPKKARTLPSITFKHLAWLIRLLNFVLIPAATLYCLMMLFCLKVSLLGRLGGINHISRAFFLSLLMLVLIFPWQRFFFFADIVAGATYTSDELATWVKWYTGHEHRIFAASAYYLRFSGYWLVVMLLLIFSLLRSVRWAKATLRRLEIM